MKKQFYHLIPGNSGFRKEFRQEVRLLIIITLAFTIAFTWRQTTFDLSEALINYIFNFQNKSALSIYASIFITITSLIIIYITSHFLKDKSLY